MIDRLIAEATECDFKVALETKKPKSWLKSVSSFSKLRERYKAWTGNSWEDKLFDSFEIREAGGKLSNAGALLADNAPIRHSRLFCTVGTVWIKAAVW